MQIYDNFRRKTNDYVTFFWKIFFFCLFYTDRLTQSFTGEQKKTAIHWNPFRKKERCRPFVCRNFWKQNSVSAEKCKFHKKNLEVSKIIPIFAQKFWLICLKYSSLVGIPTSTIAVNTSLYMSTSKRKRRLCQVWSRQRRVRAKREAWHQSWWFETNPWHHHRKQRHH